MEKFKKYILINILISIIGILLFLVGGTVGNWGQKFSEEYFAIIKPFSKVFLVEWFDIMFEGITLAIYFAIFTVFLWLKPYFIKYYKQLFVFVFVTFLQQRRLHEVFWWFMQWTTNNLSQGFFSDRGGYALWTHTNMMLVLAFFLIQIFILISIMRDELSIWRKRKT
jgi:hypothetical protein